MSKPWRVKSGGGGGGGGGCFMYLLTQDGGVRLIYDLKSRCSVHPLHQSRARGSVSESSWKRTLWKICRVQAPVLSFIRSTPRYLRLMWTWDTLHQKRISCGGGGGKKNHSHAERNKKKRNRGIEPRQLVCVFFYKKYFSAVVCKQKDGRGRVGVETWCLLIYTTCWDAADGGDVSSHLAAVN